MATESFINVYQITNGVKQNNFMHIKIMLVQKLIQSPGLNPNEILLKPGCNYSNLVVRSDLDFLHQTGLFLRFTEIIPCHWRITNFQ